MSSLQPLAPRRSSVSPKTKTRNGVSRNVFALPMIHQFEPVLASSPKSYMIKKAAKKQPDSMTATFDHEITEVVSPTTIAGSSSLVPSQLMRPKSKETAEIPRVLRPQPPVGLSSRTDVNIYRYSQGAEQRMAIRPLFERRRDSGAGEEARPASTKPRGRRGVKKRGDEAEIMETVGNTECHPGRDEIENGNRDGEDRNDVVEVETERGDGITVKEELDGPRVQSIEVSNQEDIQIDCKLRSENDHVSVATLPDMEPPERIETQNVAPEDYLLKPLSPSSYYEPFLQTEGPILNWLRNALEVTSPNFVEMPILSREHEQPAKSSMLVYKVLSKNLQTFGDKRVHSTVLLSSRGDAHITCKTASDENMDDNEVVVPITDADLIQSKLLRPDLQTLTPKWADWIITRVRCDSRSTYFIDLADEASQKRCCFSEIVQLNGQAIAVDMVALQATSSLLVTVKEASASKNRGEVLLRRDELLRLALSMDKCKDELDEAQAVHSLLDDHEFLFQLATKSNLVCLGTHCDSLDDDLKFPSTNDAVTIPPNFSADNQIKESSLAGLELVDTANFVQPLLDEKKQVGTVALLAQAYVENCILSTLRCFQRQEAVQLNVAALIQQATQMDNQAAFNERVERNMETARMSKLQEIAIASIVNDMIFDFIAFECRVEINGAKYSGGYDDHYASKLQATYRMSAQKRMYDHKKQVRMRAAQMLQALQRGIIARRRYCEMKVEREKYLFYGFRSSLYHATANMKDPRLQARELSQEAERRRHAFFMQVLQGYVAENFADDIFRISVQLVREICSEYSVVVGCSANFGDVVASYLDKSPGTALYASLGNSAPVSESATPVKLYTNSQVSAALLLALRDQYDDTFGLSSSARVVRTETKRESRKRFLEAERSAPPRWMLKTCAAFQQSNRNCLAGLRLTRKAAGRKSAHLVARDYRNVLSSSFDSFDSCRATWEADIGARQDHQHKLDTFSADELVQHCLDLLISSVKDLGIDPNPLFEALNLCDRHCHGKAAIAIVEKKFNEYAARMNEVHGKQSVLTLREEVSQELEDFEKLLALRCLNMTLDDAVTVPTSELLHIMLKGNLDEEYIRHGLSVVLPITTIVEKSELARKMLHAYANASYGDAFNLICWSCLDVVENVTVEAAQFLDKITRLANEGENSLSLNNEVASSQAAKKATRTSESLTARALYLLTGTQAVRFLQFLAKVAHFNKAIQKRVLSHLTPYAEKFEMHRLASAVCAVDDFAAVSHVFDECFSVASLQSCESIWRQYRTLFGEEQTSRAMTSINLQPNTLIFDV